MSVSSLPPSPTPKPIVAVVGRPNVGKSTLVNRLVGRRDAIVEERPGVTRDRKVLEADWRGRSFTLVDTGGWISRGTSLDAQVTAQAERAVRESDVSVLVVDAAVGVTEEDAQVAEVLRRSDKPYLLVANKVDGETREADAWEFARLGMGDPYMVSALHGRGSGDLLDAVVERLPAESTFGAESDAAAESSEPAVTSVAIVGRPNVGKSTLFNRLVGDERSIVHDLPGTTRDTIDTVIETDDGPIRFVDTAGLRRRAKEAEGPEYYSLVRALQAIDRVDAAVFLIDAIEGVTHQDQRLAERVDAAGNPIVIVARRGRRRRGPVGVPVVCADLEGQRQDGVGGAQTDAGLVRRHRRLPPAGADQRAQQAPLRGPVGPSLTGRTDPLRHPGRRPAADVYPVRHQAGPADLPSVFGAPDPGTLQLRSHAPQVAGPKTSWALMGFNSLVGAQMFATVVS